MSIGPPTHLKLLDNSSKVVLALDEQFNQIVGFITALSDGVLSAYIPFLEVLPAYKSKGNGKELNNGILIRNDGMQSGVSNG